MASDLGSISVLLKSIARVVNANQKRIQLVALKEAEGRLKQRIFNKGLGTEGRNIGRYKIGAWKTKRELAGRQTSKVDLEFTSDLRNGIQIGTNGNDLVLGFISDLQRKKADGNTSIFKKPIFPLSTTEEKAVEKAVIREIDEIIRKLI